MDLLDLVNNQTTFAKTRISSGDLISTVSLVSLIDVAGISSTVLRRKLFVNTSELDNRNAEN